MAEYGRSHQRFTWRGRLYRKKSRCFKILSHARNRRNHDLTGTCAYYSLTTALQAAYRASGVEIGELSWEELREMVNENEPCRATASLRVLKYHGIRTEVDYRMGNMNAKRFKISQFFEFCNVEQISSDDASPCGLDRNNVKAAIDNVLSKHVMVAHFPISNNYDDMLQGLEHIYAYDEDDPKYAVGADGADYIYTHMAVITGFGFEENVPYFQFLDCNGQEFGDKGFCRILPSSIISIYGFDVIVD